MNNIAKNTFKKHTQTLIRQKTKESYNEAIAFSISVRQNKSIADSKDIRTCQCVTRVCWLKIKANVCGHT